MMIKPVLHSSQSFVGFVCTVNALGLIQLYLKFLMAKANQTIKV